MVQLTSPRGSDGRRLFHGSRDLHTVCRIAATASLFPSLCLAQAGIVPTVPSASRKPEVITLTRRLAPVAARAGVTVNISIQGAGPSVPPEAIAILKQHVETLILDAKAGDISLIEDGAANTNVKCTITSYEPKTVQANQRQVGNEKQKLSTWIGNIWVSVQVTDGRDRPLVASNAKFHLENDFITATQDQQATKINDSKVSKTGRLAGTIAAVKGGRLQDLGGLVGQGATVAALTQSEEKGVLPPTDAEWRDALIEGMAIKIASLIVPVSQEIPVFLPSDKAFGEIRTLAKDKRWGDVQEKAEMMGPLKGNDEAYRLYLIGLSHEALGLSSPKDTKGAEDELNKATASYSDAAKVHDSREFTLASMRVKDSLDHLAEIDHYVASNPNPSSVTIADGDKPKQVDDVPNNAALIDMVSSGLPESVLLTYVQTVQKPKFDASAQGLMGLSKAKVSPNIISAVQKRMAGATSPNPKSISHTAKAQSSSEPH